ncbi:MAG: alcohol dehydrogenase catalytic domain-containing protein [Spirochaetota bacterium]|nr:MAG: alcohol dehydrogenase catalytic domain-containing protein [Spirochaetota bacterium]
MQVGVCYGPGDIRIEDKPLYVVQKNEVLVRVAYCGVCPSDVRVYAGLSTSSTFPCILGHECAGIVEAVGKEVTSVSVGNRVVVDPTRRCGRCDNCRRGYENACENADYSRGSFAEYTVAWESNVYKISEDTPLENAAFAEPLASVLHGFKKANIQQGDSVLIIGAGPIGLMHLQLAKLAGAQCFVSEALNARRKTALTFGADAVLDPKNLNIDHPLVPKRGFEEVIVAVGKVGAVQQAAKLVAHGGRLVLFAGFYPPEPMMLDPNHLHYKEIDIIGSYDCARWDFEQSIRLIESGKVNVTDLVSNRFPLYKLSKAMEAVMNMSGLKVMIMVQDIAQEEHKESI